jgi:hypothetical protein
MLYRLSIESAQLRFPECTRRPGAFFVQSSCVRRIWRPNGPRARRIYYIRIDLTFFCFNRYISEGDDAGAISEEDDDDDAEEEVEVEEEDEAETAPRE